ncbi:hypothetical protein [Actinacidiphila rubida]|uniref:Uncharacterized protein n=1 Tax=Actinacidiphila rubida TaxID=310780 RepID=A0A1H8TE01_9ACTN|nr:hypothetical protein [Actinacidiphila rubida]SEO88718.1 hypothetical protein SAMN05216267_105124 [Actinacidiphila rubida]
MITQGVKITTRCHDCGGELTRDVGQFTERGQVRWGIEGQCQNCPNAWCEQGSGATPEEIREALLAQQGPARLRLAGPEPSMVPVLRALRELHGLSLAQARAMAHELRTTGLTGTLVEMECVAAGLRRRSVAVTIETAAG